MSIRNAMLPVPPHLPYPSPVPPAAASTAAPAPGPSQPKPKPAEETPTDSEQETLSDTGSDADIESGPEGSAVGESWISLKKEAAGHA